MSSWTCPKRTPPWVNKGDQADIRIQVLKGKDFTGQVVRTSYALDRTARTLVAEIDLPNPNDLVRPNMYAYATLTAEHRDVLTLPASAPGDAGGRHPRVPDLLLPGRRRESPTNDRPDRCPR